MNHAEQYEYLVNKMAAIRWRGSDLDASYHAALFLMASHPALFQKMDRYLCPEGIDFTKMMRKEEFEYDWMKITADAARNLFSWNSKCAANLASWLAARGAEVAYIEVNQNRHLQLLLNIYEAAPDGEHYTIDGIDCYLTNEPDKAYQFIIYDCGVMQTPTSIFRDADHRLLCGSVLPYEIPVFHKALSECGSLEVRPVAICVPQEIQEYCMELFGENVQIAAASHDLFAKRVNGQIYRPLVEKYIAGEKRL